MNERWDSEPIPGAGWALAFIGGGCLFVIAMTALHLLGLTP
jgi:hypothetical protein